MKLDRVVLFHDYSQPLGGASFLVQVLITQLRDLGIPVTFFAGDDGRNFKRTDVEFIALHGRSLLERSKIGALTAGFYNFHVYEKVREWVKRNDTPNTIYHLHGWSQILTPAIFRALRSVSDKLILHGHDYFNCCPNGGFFNFAIGQDCRLAPLSGACLASQCDKSSYKQKLWRSARERLRRLNGGVAGARRLLMIHPGQAENFRRGNWPADRLFTVRNPVSPPCVDRVRAEENAGVVFIGRISREKGADLAALAAGIAEVPITFVGDGSEMEKVRALNANALFLGRQDRAGVAKALALARLAVMPSRWSEPFGLTALEAVGSGVPVIVSDRALIASEIDRAGFGIALDTSDVSVFSETICSMHRDNDAVKKMSLAGFNKYTDICNNNIMWVNQIIFNYVQVLN